MAERGLTVDHTAIWRWTQTYGPEVYRRLQGEVKRESSTWHVDETFVRIVGKWIYLFRAVDAHGQTVDFYLSETRDREAAKIFLQKALANPDNRPPHVLATDGLGSYLFVDKVHTGFQSATCDFASSAQRGYVTTC
jgi:IS6 family transposase